MIDMRDRLPPEKVLKKSSTPPCCVWNRLVSARGSMPGMGTNDSSRNSTSAPSVNHSRFLSSVALEKLASEILEASCSAADAIDNPTEKIQAATGLSPPPPDIVTGSLLRSPLSRERLKPCSRRSWQPCQPAESRGPCPSWRRPARPDPCARSARPCHQPSQPPRSRP